MQKQDTIRALVDDELSRRVEELSREVGMSPRELVREVVEEFAAAHKPSNGTKPRTELD